MVVNKKDKSRSKQMKFYLSVFGGGTSTEMVVFNEEFKVLSRGRGNGVNYHYEPYQNVMKSLSDAIVQCTLDLFRYGFEGKFAGVYGTLLTPIPLIEIQSCIDTIGYTVEKYVLDTEPYCYLISSSLSDKGAIAISGTGSLAAYYGSATDYITTGGFGIPYGDDGSSTWIGIQGLNAVTRAAMGWGERTILFDLLSEEGSCLYHRISEEEKKFDEKRYMYVDFSRKVIHGASLGDNVCITILKEAGEIMGRQILSAIYMYKKGIRGMGYKDYFPQQGLLETDCEDFGPEHVYACGKTWTDNPIMFCAFESYIHTKQPSIICEHAKYGSAYAGLILYAMENNMVSKAESALSSAIIQ